MSISVVMGIQDYLSGRGVEELLEADGGFAVKAVASSPDSLLAAVLDHEPDVILLDEGFGPAPALTVARDLVARLPWVAIVLLTREPTLDLHIGAADSGVRALVAMPPSLADLTARLTAAAWWSRTVRLGSEAKGSYDEAGTVLAVAGAKGGVGTTTLATQLAFVAAGAKDARVCLVDFDLFGADLAAYLATTATRSLLDLVGLADELSPGVLQPMLFPHESGVRVLFSPEDVTDAELITASVTRRTIGVLRAMFDVVVIDCGSQVVDAALPAIELADRVALVTTPDLLSIRSAHRVVDTWERLDVRRTAMVELVINRASRSAAVQPRLVGQTAAMPVCRVVVPAAFAALESLANEGATGLKNQKVLSRPLTALASHFGIHRPPVSRFAPLWRRRRPNDEGASERLPQPVADARARRREALIDSGRDRGMIGISVAVTQLLVVGGVIAIAQLVLLGTDAAALATVTPLAAQRVGAAGADKRPATAAEVDDLQVVRRVEADLRASQGSVLDHVTLARRGERLVVKLPVRFVVPLPGFEGFSLTSDAVIPRARP